MYVPLSGGESADGSTLTAGRKPRFAPPTTADNVLQLTRW